MSERKPDINGGGDSFGDIVGGVNPFQRSVDIPNRCMGCPGVLSLLEMFDRDATTTDALTQLALDRGLLASSGCEAIQRIAEATGADWEEVVDEITRLVGEAAVERLKALDDAAEKAQKLINQATDGCKGPVKITGRGHDGRPITVTVCDSPVMNSPAGTSNLGETVVVHRGNPTMRCN